MTIPAFGHGELEWVLEKGKGSEPDQLRVKYALPWDHPEHTPTLIGSATFYSTDKTTPVNYVIRYVPANVASTQTITSADGKLQVQVSANGQQVNALYMAIIQGYPPKEPFTTAYEIVGLRVPNLQDANSAKVEDYRYPWGKSKSQEQLLPNEYTVSVTIPAGQELCRWVGWKRPVPVPDMEEVSSIEMANLKKLGVFMLEAAPAT